MNSLATNAFGVTRLGTGASAFNFSGTNTFGSGAGSTLGGANAAGNQQLTLGSSNQSSAEVQQQIKALLDAPFGDSPLFKNPIDDPAKKKEVSEYYVSCIAVNQISATPRGCQFSAIAQQNVLLVNKMFASRVVEVACARLC